MAVSSITVRTVDTFLQITLKLKIQLLINLKLKIKEAINKKKVKSNFFRILIRI
jgi:hypothetical protein